MQNIGEAFWEMERNFKRGVIFLPELKDCLGLGMDFQLCCIMGLANFAFKKY